MVLLIAGFGFSLSKFCSSPFDRRATEVRREGDLANVTEASKAIGSPDCLTLKQRTLPKLSHWPTWLRRRNIHSQRDGAVLPERARYLKGWGRPLGVSRARGAGRGQTPAGHFGACAEAPPRSLGLGLRCASDSNLAAALAAALLVDRSCLVRRLALP